MRIFLLLVLLITACNGNPTKKQRLELAADIQKIKLTTLRDTSIDLGKYKGKAVFINFWATWCKPCVLEMPTIRNAMDSLKNENIEFLFASDESVEDIQRFEKKYRFQFDYFHAHNSEELGIMILPTTFIFDKNGKQVYSETGYRKWDDSSSLDMLLKFAGQK